MRKTDGCLNCGETREIAAHGLCYMCYRRQDRSHDRLASVADRHNPGIRREHKKILRGFTSVMGGLGDLGVSREEVLLIRTILEPYLGPVADYLAPAPPPAAEDKGNASEREHNSNTFTVHHRHESAGKREEDNDGENHSSDE